MQEQEEQEAHWDERYELGDTPWESGRPSVELLRVIKEIPLEPCAVLEIGCGTGTNALELARRGFAVTAIDVAPAAIEEAREQAAKAGLPVTFLQADALNWPPPRTYDFIFDRSTYHVLRHIDVVGYLATVRAATHPGSLLLALCGNAQDPAPAGKGPTRISAQELLNELGLLFDLVHLREFNFERTPDEVDEPYFLGWSSLWRRRAPGAIPEPDAAED